MSIFHFVQIIHSRLMNIIDENQVAKASQDSLSIHDKDKNQDNEALNELIEHVSHTLSTTLICIH